MTPISYLPALTAIRAHVDLRTGGLCATVGIDQRSEIAVDDHCDAVLIVTVTARLYVEIAIHAGARATYRVAIDLDGAHVLGQGIDQALGVLERLDAEIDRVLEEQLLEDMRGVHCDDCDPSLECFDGGAECQKEPIT